MGIKRLWWSATDLGISW